MLLFPSIRSKVHWYWRASGALQAYARGSRTEVLATIWTGINALSAITRIAVICFRQPSPDAPWLWANLAALPLCGEFVSVTVVGTHCIPPGRLTIVWRSITMVRIFTVVHCLSLTVDWHASLRSDAAQTCIILSYGSRRALAGSAVTIQFAQVAIRAFPGCTIFGCY